MRTRAAALLARRERACGPVPGRPQAYWAAQRRLIAFRAAASWRATDYLAVMPDLCVRAVEEGEEFEGGYFALSTAEFDLTAYSTLESRILPSRLASCAAGLSLRRQLWSALVQCLER